MKKILPGLLIAVLLGIGSCSEDEVGVASLFKISSSGCKLKKVIASLDPEDYDVQTFEYDSQGKLISTLQQFADTSYTTKLFYNDKNQLIKREPFSGTDYDYYYQITWKNDLPFLVEQVYEGDVIGTKEFTFTTSGVTKILDVEHDITHEFIFIYRNGNLYEWYDGDDLRLTLTKYDSKHNPYRNMISAFFTWGSYFSKNNVTQAVFFGDAPSSVTYTYNKNGYPVSDSNNYVYEYVDCD